jgi:hypothetical protein
MESWFSTVKSEAGERFEGYAHAKEVLFDYIEVFYNQRRRLSTLGQISPAEFEKRAVRRVDPVENCQERSFPPAPHASSASLRAEHRTKDDQLTATVTESDQAQAGGLRLSDATGHNCAERVPAVDPAKGRSKPTPYLRVGCHQKRERRAHQRGRHKEDRECHRKSKPRSPSGGHRPRDA